MGSWVDPPKDKCGGALGGVGLDSAAADADARPAHACYVTLKIPKGKRKGESAHVSTSYFTWAFAYLCNIWVH